MNTFGVEKATVIRYPSTANLMVDSADRNETVNPSAWDFQIVKPQSTMNGFFSRIGTTEVVLEWAEPNIVEGTITLDISGATTRTQVPFTIYNTFFNVATLLSEMVVAFSGTNGVTFTVSSIAGQAGLNAAGGKFRVISTPLALQLGIDLSTNLDTRKQITGVPDLRLYRYLDFVSPQITYAQDLKDNSTAPINKDVLCRWYMAEDSQEAYDSLGYPILMGYEPFVRRRLYNPPKQIKWDNNLQLGNLSFQVYDEDGDQLPQSNPKSNFLMTLQFSEN